MKSIQKGKLDYEFYMFWLTDIAANLYKQVSSKEIADSQRQLTKTFVKQNEMNQFAKQLKCKFTFKLRVIKRLRLAKPTLVHLMGSTKSKVDPSQKFEWCICALRMGFQSIFQSIFTGSGTITKGFLAVLACYLCAIVSLFYTMAYYEKMATLTAAITLFGVSQVR